MNNQKPITFAQFHQILGGVGAAIGLIACIAQAPNLTATDGQLAPFQQEAAKHLQAK